MDVKEVRYVCVGWIHLALDKEPVSDSCERGDKPQGCLRGGEFLERPSDCL